MTTIKLENNPTYVGALCHTNTRKALLELFVERGINSNDKPLMTKEVIEAVDISRYAINQNIEILLETGVIEKEGSKRHITYKPALESDSFNALLELERVLEDRSYTIQDGLHLTTLFSSQPLGKLNDYFLRLGMVTDESELEPLTKSDIEESTGVARKTIIDYIDTSIEYGVIKENNEFSYPRYLPDADSDVFEALVETNKVLESA